MPAKEIPLVGTMTSMYSSIGVPDASSVDPPDAPYYINGYFEVQQAAQDEIRKWAYVKRPGIDVATGYSALSSLAAIAFTNNSKIQGLTSSFDKTKISVFWNDGTDAKHSLFDASTNSSSTISLTADGWTKTGAIVQTQLDGISYGTGNYWAITDFSKGAVITSANAYTLISDVDFTGLVKATNFAAIDGFLLIGTTDNRIYNSDLNTPTSWQATSFISAIDTPGNLLWLHRLRNFVIAFKDQSLEIFEDTGNPAPGSPLTSQKQLNQNIGLLSRSSVKEVVDGVIFLGVSKSGKAGVYKISKETLRVTEISDQFMSQVLGSFAPVTTAYNVEPGSGTNRGEAQVITYRGKEFYVLYTSAGTASGAVNRSWVYDNDLGIWVRWATCMTAHNVLDSNFTPTQATSVRASGSFYTVMAQNFFSDASHKPIFAVFTPVGVNFADTTNTGTLFSYPLIWVSDIMDFGTRKRKFLDSLEILFDSYTQASDTGTPPQFTLYYRDHDFLQTSYVTRTINYTPSTTLRAIFRRLGSFRKRSFALKQIDTVNFYPLRIWGVEVTLNTGETDQDG